MALRIVSRSGWGPHLGVAVLLFGSMGLGGCADVPTDPVVSGPAPLTGTWQGTLTVQAETYVFTLEVVDQNTVITGQGHYEVGGTTVGFAIRGSYIHPNVNLQWSYTDRPPTTASGLAADDRQTLSLQVSGAGFGGDVLVLER